MSEEKIKNILGSINYEVETDKNWVEPVGLDRDTWKELLNYIQQKENIIKEAREYIESYMPNYDFDKTNLIKLLEILGSDKE